jgi:hypothetical protein
MDRSIENESPSQLRGVWLVLLPPIIWSVYHLVGYFLVEVACQADWLTGMILGMRTLTAVVLFLTLLALLGTLWTGWRAWQAASSNGNHGSGGENRERFLGIVGSTFSIILVLTILADGASMIALRPCW